MAGMLNDEAQEGRAAFASLDPHAWLYSCAMFLQQMSPSLPEVVVGTVRCVPPMLARPARHVPGDGAGGARHEAWQRVAWWWCCRQATPAPRRWCGLPVHVSRHRCAGEV